MTTDRTQEMRVVLPRHLAQVVDEGVAYVAVVPAGPIRVLEESSAVIWSSISDGGTVRDVVERTAAVVGLSSEDVGEDVQAFLGALVALGLVSLEPADAVDTDAAPPPPPRPETPPSH